MKALITGSAGFVGRHMTTALQEAGYDVWENDIKGAGGVDCRDLFRALNERFDVVVHCAAVVGGRTFIDGHPLQLAVEDLSIDAEMFRFAMRTRPKHIVYYSSSAAYPVQYQRRENHQKLQEDMINLDDIEHPDAMYGWVKLTGEQLAHHAYAAGLNVSVLRPMSGYGADQDLTYPFPAIMERVRNNEDPLIVWGDGLQTRDWVHIDDIVAMTMKCIDVSSLQRLNIGTGIPTNFNTLAGMAAEVWGYKPTIVGLEDKPTGVDWRVASVGRSHQLYKPKISLLEGITRALKGE